MRLGPLHPVPGSPGEATRFRELQTRLRDRFLRFAADPAQPYTAVVVPSMSVDPVELAKIPGATHYEERLLVNLMLLRHPRMEIVYVTSKRLDPMVVDYFLHQLRGVPPGHARHRLRLFDCDDASPRPLSEKLLERPLLLQRVRRAVADPAMAHLVVFNSSPLERTLSVQLDIPLFAPDPDLAHLGTKTGSRQVFRRAGVPLPPGREALRDVQDLAEAAAETWEELPAARRLVVKLDQGFSGEGNALLELEPLQEVAPGSAAHAARVQAIEAALPTLRFEAEGLDWEHYRAQFDRMGGVCELWLDGRGKVSPSAQLRIDPLGQVHALSTHDQVLGGPNGQVFHGATFPADAAYRLDIQRLGLEVGAVLAQEGAIGRFGVDFLVMPGSARDHVYAVEINLRQGGTTHPLNTLKFITDGHYDAETGRFHTAQGLERAYFATDVLQDEAYRGLLPCDLIDLLVLNGVHVGPDDTGIVCHLLGCLSEHGKLGCVCIAPTVPEARQRYARFVGLLDALCGRVAQA